MRDSYDFGLVQGDLMPQQLSRLTGLIARAAMFLVLVLADDASAQSTLATLTGTVTDESGAVLPGVTVTATSTSTGVLRTGVTTQAGEYQLPNLDAGQYVLALHLERFADAAREVTLLARQIVR